MWNACFFVGREKGKRVAEIDEQRRREARVRARELAAEFLARHDDTGWFDAIYKRASGDPSVVPWANLAPSRLLLEWLTTHLEPPVDAAAVVVGCGLGDDAEELADWSFRVTAFDISETAVNWCRDRFVGSAVTYKVADLLHLPNAFLNSFDFVLESYTVQALRGEHRRQALLSLPKVLARNGTLLLICRGRDEDEDSGTLPWPLTRAELGILEESGLTLINFEDFYDNEEPPVRRFRAEYMKL